MTEDNPTDRSKLGTKRHILTDKKGVPLSVLISPASTHDINLVTDVVDNTVIKRSKPKPNPYRPNPDQEEGQKEDSIYVWIKDTNLHNKNKN